MSNQKILFLQGLPASGKSTFSKQYCIDNPDFMRINKDDIREELGNLPFSRSFENTVLSVERSKGLEIINMGKSLIIDDTNFAKKHETYWKKIASNSNIEFEIKRFDVPVEECIKRDKEREKSVGSDIIIKMYEKYF